MKTIKKLFAVATGVALLNGCVVIGVPEPTEFSAEHSYAFNVANQTHLTKNNSPLRDFTREEIEESKNILERRTEGANASKVLGMASVLTGNLTGIFHVAGGVVSDTALSGHLSEDARWIVALDSRDFATEKEASAYIAKAIHEATVQALEEYSEVKLVESSSKISVFYQILFDGEYQWVKAGYLKALMEGEKFRGVELVSKGSTNLIEGGDAYLFGFDTTSNGIFPIEPANLELIGFDVDRDEFLKKLTSLLPQGFYFYSPSYPKFYGADGKKYVAHKVVVPAIYTQGEKYEFIKPE